MAEWRRWGVPPRHPRQRRQLDILDGPPGAAHRNELGLVEPDDRFGRGVAHADTSGETDSAPEATELEAPLAVGEWQAHALADLVGIASVGRAWFGAPGFDTGNRKPRISSDWPASSQFWGDEPR
jgi:hypothetical protein